MNGTLTQEIIDSLTQERDTARGEARQWMEYHDALKARLETAEKERDVLSDANRASEDGRLAMSGLLDAANAERDKAVESLVAAKLLRTNEEVRLISENRSLSHQLASAHETHDTILSVLNGRDVNTDSNEAAIAVRNLMLKGVQRLWRPIESAPILKTYKDKPYVLAVDAKERMAVGYFHEYSTGERGFTSAKPISNPVKWMPLPTAPI